MSSINGKDLRKAGWKPGPIFERALRAAQAAKDARTYGGKREILGTLGRLWASPHLYTQDPFFGGTAQELMQLRAQARNKPSIVPLNDTPIEYAIWGEDQVDSKALDQMAVAARLPVSVRGAQMPDGHLGYGLPIGGVLATRDAVIPYAVGVDIACRVRMTVLDVPAHKIDRLRKDLVSALHEETAFGMGAGWRGGQRRRHAVLEDERWRDLPQKLQDLKPKAHGQLGSSGSGNHFVEWGEFVIEEGLGDDPVFREAGLEAGKSYLALLSHSGSRGFGAATADYFTRIAMEQTPLPKEAKHLAWLGLDTDAGQAYWNAMELAGEYASANHQLIHETVLKSAGLSPALAVENHHNFAWKETHETERGQEELIVHRKGATPAAAGELGVIPGTMADPGYLVRGKGNATSLNSAAHGAGRRMSRRKAKETFTKADVTAYLKNKNVELLAAGLDEAPMAYKKIKQVMAAQEDLVEPLAQFHPRIVKMADGGPAED